MWRKTKGMRSVLMIAYYFPPIAATGAMRPLNFCRHLPSYGWMPSVLATDHSSALPPQAADQMLLNGIAAGTEVVRVAHGNPLGRLLAYRDRLKRIVGNMAGAASRPSFDKAVTNAAQQRRQSPIAESRRFIVDAVLNFPDPQCRWYRSAVQAMSSRSTAQRPNLIWATGGPWTSLLVGQRLAREWAVPLVADFRDPWVGGHEFFSSRLLHRRAVSLERGVCEAASRVVLNTEELRERFSTEYPQWQHKFVAITNGYAQDLAQTEKRSPMGTTHGGSAVELCHFGTVYGNRSPLALFRAIQELIAEGRLDSRRLKLRFVGAWDVEDLACTQLAKFLEEQGVLKRTPPIPHQECLTQMAQSDVLLILQPDYPLQIPAKIYEYIVAGRPLFVLGGEGATANLVQRHRLGRCCPNRVQEAKRALIEVMTDRSTLAAPNPADTAQFSYPILSKRLADLFNEVVGEEAMIAGDQLKKERKR
jgi:hypothetical protein